MALRGAGRARGSTGVEVRAPTTAAAYYVCALGSYDEVKSAVASADCSSTAGLLLAATASQCEGDVLRAESSLRRAAETASGDDCEYVADMLAPLLISRGLFARASAMLGAARVVPALEIGRLALRSIVDAATGAIGVSEQEAATVHDELAGLDDDVLRLRVSQRLALAAYYRGDAAAALEEVGRGLQAARRANAHRAACTLNSVAYATYYSIIGDFGAAWHHALALGREAQLGGDESYGALSRVAIYELAAERSDDLQLAITRAALASKPLPEQYRERFSIGIADALRLAWAGDLATSRNVLVVLKDTVGRSDSERALCRGLLAVVAVALGDDEAARRFSRQAISTSARPKKHIAAYELRYRRLGRVLAVIAGEMIGDVVRGRRAADARFLREDPEVSALLELRAASSTGRLPVSVRGYARVVGMARERLNSRPAAGLLTQAETEILRLVAAGRTAPEIARIIQRSPHTVRTHLRNVSAKLDVHGRIEMLTRARNLGILPNPQYTGFDGAST